MIIKIGREQRKNSVYILFALGNNSLALLFCNILGKENTSQKIYNENKKKLSCTPQKKDRFCYRRQPENLRAINKTSYKIAKLVYPQVIVS